VAAAAQAAPRHGEPGSCATGRIGRCGRERDRLPDQAGSASGGQGRSHVGKLSADRRPGRIRLDRLEDFSAASIAGFVGGAIAPGATIVSDGLQAYRSLKQHKHQRKVVGSMAAHVVLPWIHRVFANLKRWGLGTFHGMREAHLHRYLDEFVFRWNRRRHTRAAFGTLVGLTMCLGHASYRDFVDQRI
jgi:hypothetical protein